MTLETLVQERGRLTPPSAAALAAILATELTAPHGEVKPSNVLLTREGAQLLPADAGPARESSGAVDFMSPERALGIEKPSRESDIFSVGATLAFAASGERPYGTETRTGSREDVRRSILNDPPNLGGTDKVQGELRDLIMSCLQREPTDRPTAAQLRESLGAANGEAAAAHELPWWHWQGLFGADPALGPPWFNWEEKFPAGPSEDEVKKAEREGKRRKTTFRVTIGALAIGGTLLSLTLNFGNSQAGNSSAGSQSAPSAAVSSATPGSASGARTPVQPPSASTTITAPTPASASSSCSG